MKSRGIGQAVVRVGAAVLSIALFLTVILSMIFGSKVVVDATKEPPTMRSTDPAARDAAWEAFKKKHPDVQDSDRALYQPAPTQE